MEKIHIIEQLIKLKDRIDIENRILKHSKRKINRFKEKKIIYNPLNNSLFLPPKT